MKTSSTSMPAVVRLNCLGRGILRHRFLMGALAGGLVALAFSGSWRAIAATGVGTLLLSALPCALMMGVCMKMMRHGGAADSSKANAPQSPAPRALEPDTRAALPRAATEDLTGSDTR